MAGNVTPLSDGSLNLAFEIEDLVEIETSGVKTSHIETPSAYDVFKPRKKKSRVVIDVENYSIPRENHVPLEVVDVEDSDFDASTYINPFLHDSPPSVYDSLFLNAQLLKSKIVQPVQQIIHPDDPSVIVDALMAKLQCPVCFRGFRRKRSMNIFNAKLKKTIQTKLPDWLPEKDGLQPTETVSVEKLDASTIKEDAVIDTEMETTEIRVGKCGHVYCLECIKKSISKKHRCPVCNQHLSSRQLYPLYL